MTRLEESTDSQLRMFLLKVCIILGGNWRKWFGISVDERFQPRYLVSYQVLDRANPLCVHANVWSNQEATQESCKSSANHWFFASVQGPIQCTSVVGDTQYNRVRIIIDFTRCKCHKGCAVIQDDDHIFQAVDRDERPVWVVLEMQERSLDHFLWEREVPPKS